MDRCARLFSCNFRIHDVAGRLESVLEREAAPSQRREKVLIEEQDKRSQLEALAGFVSSKRIEEFRCNSSGALHEQLFRVIEQVLRSPEVQ